MKKLFLFVLMAFVSFLGKAQDSNSADDGMISINTTDSTGKHHKKSVSIGFANNKKTAYFGVDPGIGIGWNRFIDNGHIGVSQHNSELTLKKGPEFILYILTGYVDLARHHRLRLATALGFDWNTYHFERDISLVKGQDQLTITDDNIQYSKNLLRSNYLTMPLTLSFRPVKNADFAITAGMEGGLLLGAKTKQISKEHGKVKTHGTFNLNPARAGVVFGIGYQNFGLYAKYYLSDVFANGEGPKDFKTVAIGINMGLF